MTYYIKLNPDDRTVTAYNRVKKNLSGSGADDCAGMHVGDVYVEILYSISHNIDRGLTEIDKKFISIIVMDKHISASELKDMRVYPHVSADDIKKLISRMEDKFNEALEKKKKLLLDTPYLTKREVIIHKLYNPKYGDDRICECGHPYYRHFDTYDQMAAVGCKYCQCRTFVERTKPVNQKDLADQYMKAVDQQNEYEMKKFANGEEGWYNGFYYKMQGGKMTIVDSINGDNSLNYPD